MSEIEKSTNFSGNKRGTENPNVATAKADEIERSKCAYRHRGLDE